MPPIYERTMHRMSNLNLETGIRLVKSVGTFEFGRESLGVLDERVEASRRDAGSRGEPSYVVYLVDAFFQEEGGVLERLDVQPGDRIEIVETDVEPTTDAVDRRVEQLLDADISEPATLVGIGGGCTLDTTKAVANLLTNGGRAADYQGWDLVKVPAVHKIGVPTISGTGAEATRTCVMTNVESGLKLGMNSDYTVFDHLVLDPDLSATVPRNQFFYTGMDTYFHCLESLSGIFRNAVGDAYSREALNLCRQVFRSDDMMSDESREKLMVASYLGGCAIATSYVGVVHPFSAGLSVVLGLHHGVANCIAMRAMSNIYPEAYAEFWEMAAIQGVDIPTGLCSELSDDDYRALYEATVIHEKPLMNALGGDFRDILTHEKVIGMFQAM